MPRAWLTGDTLGGLVCRPVWLPEGVWSEGALRGALLELTREYRWEKYGVLEPAAVAAAFLDAFWRYGTGGCMYAGTVFWFAGSSNPTGTLDCDGQSVRRADYPRLFDVIGTVFGSDDGDSFNLPDIAGRCINGSGDRPTGGGRSVGDTGGSERVSLAESEMPAHDHTVEPHNHSVHTHLDMLVVAPGEAPVALMPTIGGTTGSASPGTNTKGSGEDHENMPPYITLRPLIQAE